MAAPTNTFQTYQAIGNRDDLIDIVTNISPRDTWFTTNSGSARATSVLHEWQTDTLASPTSNAQIEGDDVTATAVTPTARANNYTQILRKDVRIAGTQMAVNPAGRANEESYQKNKKLIELSRDIEYALLINTAAASGASGTARTTKGVLGWISTNVTTGTGTGTETLTETMVNDNLQAIWAQGGHPSAILCGGFQKRKISEFTTNTRWVSADDRTLTRAVDVYQSEFDTVRMVLSTVMNSYAPDQVVCFGDMSLWNKAWLRPIMWQEIAVTGDSKAWFAVAELALESRQEKGSGKITQLATS